MAKKNKFTPTADYLAKFDGKTVAAKDEIVSLTKNIGAWEEDLKEYRSGVRDSINEAKAKIDALLAFTSD